MLPRQASGNTGSSAAHAASKSARVAANASAWAPVYCTWYAVHADFDLPIANIMHTSCPHYYRFGQESETEEEFSTRCADELEELIIREGPDTVAGFWAEPIMGAGGVIMLGVLLLTQFVVPPLEDEEPTEAPEDWELDAPADIPIEVGPFMVQVGAFTVRDNAYRLADKLKKQYGASAVAEGWVDGRKFYRVRAGLYENMSLAMDGLMRMEADGFPNSFIVAR